MHLSFQKPWWSSHASVVFVENITSPKKPCLSSVGMLSYFHSANLHGKLTLNKLTLKSTYDLHMYHHQHCKISKLMFCVVELLQLVWIETPTNPTLKVIDIQACADVVHKHKDVLLVVDNTFMSAYFQVSTLFVYNYPVISVYLKIRF